MLANINCKYDGIGRCERSAWSHKRDIISTSSAETARLNTLRCNRFDSSRKTSFEVADSVSKWVFKAVLYAVTD